MTAEQYPTSRANDGRELAEAYVGWLAGSILDDMECGMYDPGYTTPAAPDAVEQPDAAPVPEQHQPEEPQQPVATVALGELATNGDDDQKIKSYATWLVGLTEDFNAQTAVLDVCPERGHANRVEFMSVMLTNADSPETIRAIGEMDPKTSAQAMTDIFGAYRDKYRKAPRLADRKAPKPRGEDVTTAYRALSFLFGGKTYQEIAIAEGSPDRTTQIKDSVLSQAPCNRRAQNKRIYQALRPGVLVAIISAAANKQN